MLEDLFRSEPDDGANRYRLLLFNARHGDKKKSPGELDRFLFQFVNLIQIYRSSRYFRKGAKREVQKLMREFLWNEAVQYGEAGERALYWELRNAAMRYLKTCEGSGYNRGLFGITSSGEVSRRDRICREIWQITQGLSERTGLEEELRIWNRAVTDAYCASDSTAADRLAAFEQK
ncbi:MAG: hypothetical protein IKM02_01605 [Clostridia bacterium]|nr:hypothetical protein [Clostridia bacterium]